MKLARRRNRQSWRTTLLYTFAVIHEFRWTLNIFLGVVAVGTCIYALNPVDEGGRYPGFGRALYGAWMGMLAQPFFTPGPWYVAVLNSILPLFGFVLIGEGVLRFALLMVSRRRGEKEWMNVMARTYRDHVILAGLGHLGYRIFEQLHAAGVDVVALEIDANGPFVAQTKATGVPVIIRDMRDDLALLEAGIERARTIVIATNADMANIEVAIDARKMNPKIRVLMRLYDQRIAQKLAGSLNVDVAFSASALAAPIVAGLSLGTKVLTNVTIAGVPYVVSETKVRAGCAIASKPVHEIEQQYAARVLARTSAGGVTQSPPSPQMQIEAGDTLVLHAAASQLSTIVAAADGSGC